jgi:hypothetical protein
VVAVMLVMMMTFMLVPSVFVAQVLAASVLITCMLAARMFIPRMGVMSAGPIRVMVMVRVMLDVVRIGNAGAEHHRSGGDRRDQSRPHW